MLSGIYSSHFQEYFTCICSTCGRSIVAYSQGVAALMIVVKIVFLRIIKTENKLCCCLRLFFVKKKWKHMSIFSLSLLLTALCSYAINLPLKDGPFLHNSAIMTYLRGVINIFILTDSRQETATKPGGKGSVINLHIYKMSCQYGMKSSLLAW